VAQQKGTLCLQSDIRQQGFTTYLGSLKNCCQKFSHMFVNFINILRAHFSYKSALRSFSLVTFLLCDFLAKGYLQKIVHKMLMKLTPAKNGYKLCSPHNQMAKDSIKKTLNKQTVYRVCKD
jgi:hypothetical protein